jgi:outer membrane protein TolC
MLVAAFRRLLRPRRLALSLCAAAGLAAGCEHPSLFTQYTYMPLDRVAAPAPPPPAAPPPVVTTSAKVPANSELGTRSAELKPEGPSAPHSEFRVPSSPDVIPIDLDAVMRLAEEQNRQIALARERLRESQIERELAAGAWLPKVYAGVGYYRHEGGDQNPDGTFVHSSFGNLFPGVEICTEYDIKEATFKRVDACRKLWQQRGEVAKVTNETLLDAADTYIDLLAARRGETVGHEIDRYADDLLKRTEKLNTDGSLKFVVEGLKAEAAGRAQALRKLHQQGDAAAMKVAYLLGLPHDAQLVPVDRTFAPIDLVDASPLEEALVRQAMTSGPGVRELEGLLDTIERGMAELQGPKKFMPTLRLSADEGAFGAGPGSNLTWDNRFDLGIQARWNLTEFLSAREQQRLARSKLSQVHLSYDDLKAKLALGVGEARSAILAGQQEVVSGGEMVRHASEMYRLSNLRLTENAPGGSTGEVLQAIRGLEQAHAIYLQAIREYNKAQIRLTLLLGPAACAVK